MIHVSGSNMILTYLSYKAFECLTYLKWSKGVLTMLMTTSPWPWASYQIRKIAGCACAGNAGNVFPRRRFQRKPLVSDSGMHHGTCVTHVPWCMSGSLTCGDGENVPGIPGACAPTILRIWQEAHATSTSGDHECNWIWQVTVLVLFFTTNAVINTKVAAKLLITK